MPKTRSYYWSSAFMTERHIGLLGEEPPIVACDLNDAIETFTDFLEDGKSVATSCRCSDCGKSWESEVGYDFCPDCFA